MKDSATMVSLRRKAYQLRMDVVEAFHQSIMPGGHVGGCLSAAEVMTALYYQVMKLDPARPEWEERDRFILSKGHNCMLQYAALADLHYFPKELLATYRGENSILQAHPDGPKCPGVEVTTGSLGQGLSMGVGMALAGRLKKNPYKVYLLLSDGELQSGMTWEAAMAAGHFGLSSLICLVDRNNLQVNGGTDWIMGVEPLEEKWRSFGWQALHINGHDMESILSALYLAGQSTCKPTAIICDTVKGKGVSFMEDVMEWHSQEITGEVYRKAMEELKQAYNRII